MSYASSRRESSHQRVASDEDPSIDKSSTPGSEPSLDVDITLGKHKVVSIKSISSLQELLIWVLLDGEVPIRSDRVEHVDRAYGTLL